MSSAAIPSTAMKWAFVSTLGFPPERTGGAQQSVMALCRALQATGDTTAIACAHQEWTPPGLLSRRPLIRYLVPNAPSRRQHDGVDQWRFRRFDETGWDAWAVAIRRWLARFAPDVVVVDAGLTRDIAALLASDYRTLVSLRDVEFQAQSRLASPTPFPSNATYFANSEFTAGRFREAFDLPCAVIHPAVEQRQFVRTAPDEGERILFINPDPRKGWALTLELIRQLPQFDFRIQESWPLSSETHAAVQAEISKHPNAVFHPTVADVRDAFQDARCLIVPSNWEEAWGRVVTEAQIYGIPVVAREIGGLPESVGDGGLVLPVDTDVRGWADAITSVMTDDGLRDDLIRRGKTHVDTHLASPAAQVRQLRDLAGVSNSPLC
ncbi:Glycosyltransferase involved in cell wall bisynthesis [Neorhodopirellula lusitana]|uniref:Glycosyltransferase involved in cell wall bisynthesis n=1 Tax=Neorhodopirellula lusitana TaxID=445327 RepID=A0ABY1Q518_9BACT|nr:glycosyltransferase [Neorhodopirellula lusitana]SMP59910.1 Glycosyltransferase involved in cell wall bisynthesis [Neorhodopirellula lusitana]